MSEDTLLFLYKNGKSDYPDTWFCIMQSQGRGKQPRTEINTFNNFMVLFDLFLGKRGKCTFLQNEKNLDFSRVFPVVGSVGVESMISTVLKLPIIDKNNDKNGFLRCEFVKFQGALEGVIRGSSSQIMAVWGLMKVIHTGRFLLVCFYFYIILQVRCLVLHNSIITIDLFIFLRYNLMRKEGRK